MLEWSPLWMVLQMLQMFLLSCISSKELRFVPKPQRESDDFKGHPHKILYHVFVGYKFSFGFMKAALIGPFPLSLEFRCHRNVVIIHCHINAMTWDTSFSDTLPHSRVRKRVTWRCDNNKGELQSYDLPLFKHVNSHNTYSLSITSPNFFWALQICYK